VSGDQIGFLILAGAFVLFVIGLALGEAYAAGWNASVRHHKADRWITTAEGKRLPNPFWTEYR
jgi:hypothetical protein